MLADWLGWYLAPWRRIGRLEFGIFVFVFTLPGVVFLFLGWMQGASGWLSPVFAAMDVGNQVRQGGGGDVGQQLQTLGSLVDTPRLQEPVAVAASFDWAGLVNHLLQLLMIPLCRMRLRDMGKEGPWEVGLAVLFNLSAVYGVLAVFGVDEIPFRSLFAVVGFAGFLWLCFARSAPRVAPYERIPGRQDP